MARTKRQREGYLMIDHRNSPGMDEASMVAAGLPADAGRGLFESPTATCNHCCAQVVLNPNRTRERAYCRACDSYLCDACGVERARTLTCTTIDQRMNDMLTAAERQTDVSESRILLLS
jgi:hypothetical protein